MKGYLFEALQEACPEMRTFYVAMRMAWEDMLLEPNLTWHQALQERVFSVFSYLTFLPDSRYEIGMMKALYDLNR